MNRESILEAVRSGRPFILHTADGQSYPVPHREFIAISPVRPYAIVFNDRGGWSWVTFLTVTAVQFADEAPPAPQAA